jgi:hypothetical protein
LEAHRPRHQEPPELQAIQRLQVIDEEITAAAKSGNTSKVRMLRAEKKQIEDWMARQSAAMLAQLPRPAEPPAKGEAARLESRAKRLRGELMRAQAQRAKVLAKLTELPENESLLEQVDQADETLRVLGLQLDNLHARQTKISKRQEEHDRAEERAARVREWEKSLPAGSNSKPRPRK